MPITNELYKDLNDKFADKDPKTLDESWLKAYSNILKEIAKELKSGHHPNAQEYEALLKVSTGAYKDTFINTLQQFPQEDRKEFVENLAKVNSLRKEEQQIKDMVNTMTDMLRSVPARMEAVENIETAIKDENLNPIIKNLMVEILKDDTLKDQLNAQKLSDILKIGTELSVSYTDTDKKSLPEQFIDRLIDDEIVDKETENKLLDIAIKTENNKQQILTDDAAQKQQKEYERLAKEEEENRKNALKELGINAQDENLNPIVKNLFNAILQDDSLTQNLSSAGLNSLNNLKNIDKDLDEIFTLDNLKRYISTAKELDSVNNKLFDIASDIEKPIALKQLEQTANEDINPVVGEFLDTILQDDDLKKNLSLDDIKNLDYLRYIDKSINEFDTIDQIKFNMAYTDSAQADKFLDVIADIENTHKATTEERSKTLATIDQFNYDNPPSIRPKTAYALLTCDDPNTALINVDDLYAVGQTIQKNQGKLPEDASETFQNVLKTRLSGLQEGDILPSNAKAYLELCNQCEDSNIASNARNIIADALVKYDKQHFGALNPNPDDLASVYNYAKDTLEKIDVFELPAKPYEPDLSKLELLDEQGSPLSKKDSEALKKRLAEMAREMTAREVVARKGNISTDELNQIYKESVSQILINANPDSKKLQSDKVYAVKATDLANSLAVQYNKLEEQNFRAKQKFKNHPWVKALTSSLDTIDKKLENNKIIGKPYKIAKPVLKFVGKTAFSCGKTAAIFGVAGLVPGGTGILLAYYGGKNVKQAAAALVDKDLNWKQKIGKFTFHSVSAALSLVGAAQGLEAGSEMLKNAGFDGISNVMHGAGEIINKGVGLVGQGVTAVIAHTANLLPGVQGFHSIPAESITSTLGSLSPAGRFAIMGTMMATPNIMKGTKMKFQSWRLKRKIKRETDPIKLQALNMRQQELHDAQIKNLQEVTLKVGSSALGILISSKLTPYIGELIHGTAAPVVEEAKSAVKTVEISLNDNNSQSEQSLSQAEQQQQGHGEAHKGHMANPKEEPEVKHPNPTEHKATISTSHTATHTITSAHTDNSTESSAAGAVAVAGVEQTQTLSDNTSVNATMDALKAAGVEGLEITNDATGNPTVRVIQTADNSAKTDTSSASIQNNTSAQTQAQATTATPTNEETVWIMDEATGAMIEVPAEPEKTVAMDEATGELTEVPAEPEKSDTSSQTTTADAASDKNASQQVTAQGSEAKQIKVLGFDGKEIAIPTTRADAPTSITLYQGYNEVNNYNINHATQDGILTPGVYNELKAQGIVSVDQLCQYIESHPDALTHTVSSSATNTTINNATANNTTVNATNNNTTTQSQGSITNTSSATITQTITLQDGSVATRETQTNTNVIGDTKFTTRANVELTGNNVVDYLNLTQARDGDNGTGKPQGFKFEQTGNTTTQVVQEQEVVENIVPPVEVIIDPYAEVDQLLASGRYVLDETLNRDLSPNTQFILRDRYANPHDNYMCLVIETEPHDDGTGRLTCITECDQATLFARKTGGDNIIFCQDERFSHSVHIRHGIGIPVHSPDPIDKFFHAVHSGVRLVGATVDLAHSVANLFSGGHHHHHDAPPPPPPHHGHHR